MSDADEALRRVDAIGKLPEELEPYVGQDVTLEADGLETEKGRLSKGPASYMFDGSSLHLQLYVGHPAVIVTGDGKRFDFRTGKFQSSS